MTAPIPSQTDAEKLAQTRTVALTQRQIEAACIMWRDPQNWLLTPTVVDKRNLYMRNVKQNGRTKFK